MILFHSVSILNRNDGLPGSLEKELEQHKKYVAIGYNNFYADEIRIEENETLPNRIKKMKRIFEVQHFLFLGCQIWICIALVSRGTECNWFTINMVYDYFTCFTTMECGQEGGVFVLFEFFSFWISIFSLCSYIVLFNLCQILNLHLLKNIITGIVVCDIVWMIGYV